MFLFQYLLAVVLLTAPENWPEWSLNPDLYAGLRPTLQALALRWEILDPREVGYRLTRPEYFASDLKLLRRRYFDLADAPPLCDCERFPDSATIRELLAFNRAYRAHLDSRRSVEPAHGQEVREAIQETDRLYEVWDTVRDARCEYYFVTMRRQALKRLREMLGPEAYYTGKLPPHVPLWRFASAD